MKTAPELHPLNESNLRPTILCVDDDQDLLHAIELRMRCFEVNFIQAKSGDDGFIEALKQKPSVIVLDLEMPNGNGIKTLKTLRQTAATRMIPVLILTGKYSLALKNKVIALGAKQFLMKPIQFEVLQLELSRYIDFVRRNTDTLADVQPNDEETQQPARP